MGYLIYIIIIFLAIFLSFVENLKKSRLPAICICFVLFLVAILRINTGADYEMYVDMFNYVAYYVDISYLFSHTEPLFFLLIKFGNAFYSNPNSLFILTALIIYTFIFLAVMKLSLKPAFSILLYILTTYYFISINQLRQSVSLALFLFSVIYIIKKPSTSKYYLTNIIGFGFHYSNIVSLLIYPLLYIKFTKKSCSFF